MHKKIQQLVLQIEKNKEAIKVVREHTATLEAELLALTAGDFIQEMVSREKTYGSVTKDFDGVKLTYDIKQTVSWDQERLKALLENLPVEIGSKLIRTEYSVSEATFRNQIDPALIDALLDARTTKLSKPTISIHA
jgi:hypothetical protein